jgi:hypothetical protein
MFTDDTLETQVGATLFAYFGSLLVFAKSEDEEYTTLNQEFKP